MEALDTYLNIVQLYVLITCIMLFVRWRRLKNNIYVKLIVLLSLSTEIISLLCVYYNVSINYIYNVYLILNPTLWLLLLFQKTGRKKNGRYIVSWFLAFSFYNITLGEGIYAFNFETFIVGAFTYIVMFLLESFKRLKHEDFAFFLSRPYILLTAPVMFFLGLSFMFGFKSYTLGEIEVFKNVKLYDLINHFVNIIYYSLLNLYIYKETRLKNGK